MHKSYCTPFSQRTICKGVANMVQHVQHFERNRQFRNLSPISYLILAGILTRPVVKDRLRLLRSGQVCSGTEAITAFCAAETRQTACLDREAIQYIYYIESEWHRMLFSFEVCERLISIVDPHLKLSTGSIVVFDSGSVRRTCQSLKSPRTVAPVRSHRTLMIRFINPSILVEPGWILKRCRV